MTGEAYIEGDFRFSQKMLLEFDCHTFHDFMLCYQKVDVLQLGDVLEKFRELVWSNMDLTLFTLLVSLHYPHINPLLKSPKTNTFIARPQNVYFFERGIRGGLTFVNKHKMCN